MSTRVLPCAAALLLAGACADLPQGFELAEGIEVVQHECGETAPSEAEMRLEVEGTSRAIEGALREAMFRCGQDVCGFVKVEGDTTKVLFQPCEMLPLGYPLRGVAACDCVYDLEFTARAEPGERFVEVYMRQDAVNNERDAQLVDNASVVVGP